MSLAFVLTALVVVATPGTGAVFTIAAGLSRGTRAGIVAAFGCTVGIVPHMVAAITGLAAVLNASAIAFQTIKWLGIAYLLYLAWRTLGDQAAIEVAERSTPTSSSQVIRTAVLINVLNPKLTIFFFAFLPQFVPASEAHATVHLIGLSLVFMEMTFVVFAIYARCAAAMRDRVLGRPRILVWLRRTFAATYVLLAGRLAAGSR